MIDVGILRTRIWEEVPSVMLYKDEINSVFMMKEEIDNINDDNFYVGREETLNLVKEFLRELSSNYVEFFGTIDLCIKDDDELFELFFKNNKPCEREHDLFKKGTRVYYDKGKKQFFINLHAMNTIRDAFFLVHEFMHLVSGFNDEFRVLDEVQSILGEFAFREFLIRKGYSRELINSYWKKRINGFVSKDNEFLVIMKALNDSSIKEISIFIDEIDYAIRLLKDNIKYFAGYYNARELANSTDNINDLLVKLNYIKLRYGDLRYIECVNDRILGNDNKIKKKSKG